MHSGPAAGLPAGSGEPFTPQWLPGQVANDILSCVNQVRQPLHIIRAGAGYEPGVGLGGTVAPTGYELVGSLPPLYPEWLGDRSFTSEHGVRFPYVAGEMANGIATTALVIAMARAEMLGFFGAAGLALPRIEQAVAELAGSGVRTWGVNLIHTPAEAGHEDRVVDLLLRARVPNVSASAFMAVTPAVVRCAVAGLRADTRGVVRARHLFAKVSRPEVAEQFLSPAPPEILALLQDRGQLTADEVRLAQHIPLAGDVTVEADSGGHTDNRPLAVVLPAVRALRDELARRHGFPRPSRIGPAADMFESGIRVQVLRRGTLFAPRARQLYDAYLAYPSLEAIAAPVRERIEKDVLRETFADAWARTRRFWLDRDAREADRAAHDDRHRMALVFRSYLGLSSRWAIDGEPTRRADYQIWCGPAIGAFNRWVAGSPLAEPTRRTVVQIALNLLEGAAVVTRAHQLRTHGVAVPDEAFAPRPRLLS